ncbi:hypothetical protein KPH14_013068, partial [Odynerus spinipes]
MNQGRADYLQKFDKRLFKNLDLAYSSRWATDPDLSKFLVTPSNIDWTAIEENCFRDKTNESPSIVMGNFLAQHKTTDINLYFLRILDGSHSFSIYNILTRRYEVSAPSLMFLLRLDYKNWFLNSRESYPSCINGAVNEYATKCIESIDRFRQTIVSVDSLSMILYSKLIREKKIGLERFDATKTLANSLLATNNARKVGKGRAGFGVGGGVGGGVGQSTSDDGAGYRGGRRDDSIPVFPSVIDADQSATSIVSALEKEMENDDRNSNNSSYVDFVIDSTEFFELSSHISVSWIYDYFSRSVECGEYSLVYFYLLILQIVSRFGLNVVCQESFQRVVVNEMVDAYVRRCAIRYSEVQRTNHAKFRQKIFSHNLDLSSDPSNGENKRESSLDGASSASRVVTEVKKSGAKIAPHNAVSNMSARSLLDDLNDIVSTPFFDQNDSVESSGHDVSGVVVVGG